MNKTPGWVFKTFFLMAVGGTLLGLLGAGALFWYFSRDLPKLITVADYRPLGVTRILGHGSSEGGENTAGQPAPQPALVSAPKAAPSPTPGEATSMSEAENLLGEYYKERRYLIPYEKIPEVVVQAFTSAEDDRFFDHSGINVASMVRAAIANFKAGHVVQGGSTITQQVAKSLVLTSERSFDRKFKEVIVASRLERNLTKQQILYLYLNQIYLGHGAYGVQAAARTYYRKDVSELTVAEAALLAGLPQAPTKYSPVLNPKRAKERQLYVLRRMFENKHISQGQMAEAAALPVRIYHDEDINQEIAPYYVEHVRRYLQEKYGDKALYEDGLTVIVPTTRTLSKAGRRSLREGLEAVDKRAGYRGPMAVLKTPQEIEAKLKEIRASVIERKVHFKLLGADGQFDIPGSLQSAGLRSENLLLDKGGSYQAVVTSVDDRKKSANVAIGAVLAVLPLEGLKWAKPVKEAPAARGEPTAPSKVLAAGDVIQVKVDEVSDKAVTVSLDQVPQVQGALFSLEAQTGHVLAMEGGYDFGTSEFNRAVQAQRQPGSSFKPMIYAAALEKGYTPASILVDAPIVYDDKDYGKWKPTNFEERFYGDTTFRQALIHSRNVPTIKIVQSLQVPHLIDYAKRIGMNAQLNADLSISLGSGALSLMELTRAYALFPRLGRLVAPIFVLKVMDRDGKVLEENKPLPLGPPRVAAAPVPVAAGATDGGAPAAQPSPQAGPFAGLDAYPLPEDPEQVMDPRIAYVMTHLMKEVVAFGTGHGAKSLGRPSAGKTGTTNDYIDAWYMGYTPSVISGVWVGFDNQKSIGRSETGARAALPIWLGFMREAVKSYTEEDFAVPRGVVFATIDPVSGKLAAPNSSDSIKEAFIEGTEPTETAGPSRVSADTDSEFYKEDIE